MTLRKTGYTDIEGKGLDRNLWRTRFGMGDGLSVRQTKVWKWRFYSEYVLPDFHRIC